ncbi:MAG: aspartate racemase, partial [Parasphingorhabdus sp.]
ELDLIIDTKANILPIYDSTEIHADAAIEWILADG